MKYIKLIIVLVIFVFVFWFLNRLLSLKYAETLVEGSMTSEYYKSSFDHDVIFIGDCEMYANFSPLVMYENNNIKAYVRGNSQQLIWQSYYLLKETLNYETPQFVVLNVSSLASGYKSNKINEAYNRLMIDYMRWSKEKVDLINASMAKDESFISYIFPILRYHSRYSELTSEDFKYLFKSKKNTFNGFLVNNKVVPLDKLPAKKVLASYEFPKECLEYLDKIVYLCQKNYIQLILVKSPSLYPLWYDEYDEFLDDYSQKHNLKYYNLIKEIDNIGLDYKVDTYDAGQHLNLAGATKNSKFFGDLLVKEFNLNYEKQENYDKLLEEYKLYIQSL